MNNNRAFIPFHLSHVKVPSKNDDPLHITAFIFR